MEWMPTPSEKWWLERALFTRRSGPTVGHPGRKRVRGRQPLFVGGSSVVRFGIGETRHRPEHH